ncbi:hypothetical protein AURDEDRAFT_143221 [Auricularia subglabra TFB-10046 SS5]|nr:hypothetical protein AURDEDRAFT_143221 [Auricularia subglabra TFB-10046 SS5]
MGGHAFSESLPEAQFPRMSPEVYKRLKVATLQQLLLLFRHVAVPREAPGKADYGDLDYIVAEPFVEDAVDALKTTLGTQLVVGADVATTSFAIPLPLEGNSTVPESAFVQVDVHQCATVDEFDRVVFFHAYGDLGMILGLLARSYGLSLGQNGMKLVVGHAESGEPPSFFLSADMLHIMRFFALDMTQWQRGFETQRDVFEWVRSSRLFHPACLKESARREHRRRDRAMYHNFLDYVRELEVSGVYADVPQLSSEQVIAEAKREFGKEDEYNALVLSNRQRAHYKAVFNGHLVMEWTGLYGKAVREVMDVVRASVSEEAP